MTRVLALCVLLMAAPVFAQDGAGFSHSGVGKCPVGQVVVQLVANGPPICAIGGGGGGNTCTGRVTLINGSGVLTASCIKATMTICLFQDLTTFNNQVTETAPPTDGSVTITGVNNDTIQGVCL